MVGQVKNVYKRHEGRFRVYHKSWSYRRQRHQGYLILPDVRDQGKDATCLDNAICGTMEAKLRMKGIYVKLSVDFLEKIAKDLLPPALGGQQKSLHMEVVMVLNELRRNGIPTEEDYKKGCTTGPKYKIRSWKALTWFKSTTPSAIDKLRKNGPLLAVIQISKNFTSDFLSGSVYRFDRRNPQIDGGQTYTHAVMSTGYAIDDVLPIWEMQNSHGKIGKEKGFGYFDFDSLVGLFSIDMA